MLDEKLVRDVLDRYKRDNPTLTLSENKKGLIVAVLSKIPEAAVKVFCDHLDGRLWDRSALNQQLLGSKELQLGYVPPGATGLWQNHLRNTTTVCKEVAQLVVKAFEDRLGGREKTAKRQEVVNARAKDQELLSYQAAAALYHNWLVPEVNDKEPWAATLLTRLWNEDTSLTLVGDLYRISQSKVSGPFAQKMSYHGVATLMVALRGQRAASGPMCHEHRRRVGEAKRIEFLALQQRVHDVQRAFIDFVGVKCGELMEVALDRMDALTKNCELFSSVCEEFCHSRVRIECLDSHLSLPKLLQSMRKDVGETNLAVLYLFHVSDVPLPRGCSDKDSRAAKAIKTDDADDETAGSLVAGDPRAERGNKASWQALLGAAAAAVVNSASHSALLLVHSLRAPKGGAVPFYNQEFTKTLTNARLNVDYEAHVAWAAGSPKGRPPRRLTIAVCNDEANVWVGEGLMPYSKILTLPCPKGTEDYLRVQNVLSLREMDAVDTNNLSVPDRQAILGTATYKSLFLNAKASLPTVADFNRDLQQATPGRGKRRRVTKREESADDEEMSNLKDEDVEDRGAASSPGVAGGAGSASGPGTGALPSSTPPRATPNAVGKNTMPMLVVSLGLGNGNAAVAAVETAVASHA
jgi:hypothetical protein